MARTRKLEVYKDAAGKFRWRLKAGNGRVVGASEQGRSRRAIAEANGVAAYPDAVVIHIK